MKTELIRLRTGDSAVHHGLLFTPRTPSGKGIIHVHGLAGNFYENGFISAMARVYTRRGYAFLSCNNRGHDYISDIEMDSPGGSHLKGGGAYERFEDCVYDINAAIFFLRNLGIRDICLQGHSTGCNKIVFSLSGPCREAVRSAALLSPCDDIALMQSGLGERFPEGINAARGLVREGKSDALLPPELVFYPMSAGTYLGFYEEGCAHDIFRFRNPDAPFPGFDGISIPVFASFGEKDEYLRIDPGRALQILRRKAGSGNNVKTLVFPGADHNYLGSEEELAGAVASWLSEKGF